MGRTIHYSIKKTHGIFSNEENEAMYNVSNKFNSGKYANVWTCENFWLCPKDYYPNWYDHFKGVAPEKAWKAINKAYKENRKAGLSHFETLDKLSGLGWISFHHSILEEQSSVRGFTKTQGNEFNSMLVLQALSEISKQIPSAEISVTDEGDFLICDLKIKNGKCLPLVSSLISDMERYSMQSWFSQEVKNFELSEGDFGNEFGNEFGNDIFGVCSYGDMSKYINQTLCKLKEVEKALLHEWKANCRPYFYNIENLAWENWFTIAAFCRPVNPADFLEYKMNVGTLMAGFYGEYWNLENDKDAESESYQRAAQMTKLFGGKDESVSVHILGEKEAVS
jgi:hypothetical protein